MLNEVKHLLKFRRPFIFVPRIQDDVEIVVISFLNIFNNV